MVVERGDVRRVLDPVLASAPDVEVRLVGTASSVLRGIEMPANDIDLLFRDRAGLDAWFEVVAAEYAVESAPGWLPESLQYFARVHAGEVSIELSTVEIETDADTMECFGSGPWVHFDAIACGTVTTVNAVASELRLVTELAREREDRYRPLLEHLRSNGCDAPLVERGMADLGIPRADIDRVLRHLDAGGVW